ncbi:phosphotransferase family protein [Burkholderia anthina]|uniref:phosphotransferase family protein n=1 Tax=Burkholderia anthina TaxID=179879 RepID=UPI001CF163E9|nr:phosphotransferase family protein [Burkholderia anthina]MCA8094871.1 phosphotransferase family protein [Burkholderia anthina]
MKDDHHQMLTTCLKSLRSDLLIHVVPEIQSALGKETWRLADILLMRLIARQEAGTGAANGHAADLDALVDTHPLTALIHYEDTIASRVASYREQAATVRPQTAAASITVEGVQAWLARKEARYATSKVSGIREIAGGRSKRTTIVSLVLADGSREGFVIRMDSPRYLTHVADEFPLLVALARAGVPVPPPLWFEPDAAVFGQPFIVTREMRGQPPGTLWGSNASRSPAVGLAYAQGLARVHGAPLEQIVPGLHPLPRDMAEAMIDHFEARWQATTVADSPTMAAGYRWVRRHLPGLAGATAVVHGDAGLHNFLIDGEELVCLLDWEYAHLGDPAEDLAYCRNAIESVLPWAQFVERYEACGGPRIAPERLQAYAVWKELRSATMCAEVRAGLTRGGIDEIGLAVTGIDSFSRFEAKLARVLLDVL